MTEKNQRCEACGDPAQIKTNGLFFCCDDCIDDYVEKQNKRIWYSNIEELEQDL